MSRNVPVLGTVYHYIAKLLQKYIPYRCNVLISCPASGDGSAGKGKNEPTKQLKARQLLEELHSPPSPAFYFGRCWEKSPSNFAAGAIKVS